ncbi:hypothetical protein [Antribacter gilvus]|uniref:hypothetical protein n=1 Tax=Antribacter gilvus TaxID=2304675 RepID=UPI000F76E9B4|nr:hypothetical protein [Antribacter gilvus]
MPRRATVTARAVALAGASTAVLLLAACSPTTTTLDYAPSDGARVEVSKDARLRGINLLVISEGDGAPGTLLGALTNQTSDDATFTLTAEGAAPVTVRVEAGDTVLLGTEDGEQVQLDAVDGIPGSNLPAVLSVGGEEEELSLPVFDGSLPEYADYLP